MRLFFAVEFDELIKEQLFTLQQEIRRHCSSGNFSHKDNFHLTLRFIGEQTAEQAENLKRVLRMTAAEASGFELRLNKLGSFAKGNKKIVWIAPGRSDALQRLYLRLGDELEKAGYGREEREYSPHVTLVREARLEGGVPFTKITGLEQSIISAGTISLMESKRVNDRLTYKAIDKIELL